MKIRVIVVASVKQYNDEKGFYIDIDPGEYLRDYTMDHNDPAQRRVLGEQCRNAFEAGQCVLTYPVAS